MKTFDDMLENQMKDDEFRKEYESFQSEKDVIRAIYLHRASQNKTQKDLTEQTVTNQADIKKIENGNTERRENRAVPRFVLYRRVKKARSTSDAGLELFILDARKYVERHFNGKLVAAYVDDKIPAKSIFEEKALNQMVEDAKAGKFDAIIVKNLYQLSSKSEECSFFIGILSQTVDIFFQQEMMCVTRNV